MDYTKEIINNVTVVRIKEDRLDTNIAPELKAHFLFWIDQGEHNFLVDLDQVTYADSSGLGALLFGIIQTRDKGGRLKILHAKPRVLNLIRIARLETVLEHFEDENLALESFVR
ncbi:MAG: STAS domain-containing protein [candidate division KSB1 bacterium]|nr:STAS domain-containing protein [candidate division KSB1 bacterium]